MRPGQAAEMLGITPRHCSRLLKRYRQSGPLGMNNQISSSDLKYNALHSLAHQLNLTQLSYHPGIQRFHQTILMR
ncbi:helix-turn-helix domain-containing protein [Klebsiella pneumoniae]|nr:helix-turn-helix domain-containing protein [Klebsiella pneumoniae]MCG5620690.1 helix-turn-helix domain-containing protein [Klebsiella pneumoniae]